MVLYNRGYSYYTVINVPCSLVPKFHRKQIWHSLHTKNKTVAKIRDSMIASKVNQLFFMEKQKMALNGFGGGDEDFDIDLKQYRNKKELFDYDEAVIETFALDFCYQNIKQDCKTLIKSTEALNYYNQLLKENVELFQNGVYSDFSLAVENYFYNHQLQPPTKECRPKFLKSFMLAFIQYLEVIIGYIKGNEIKEPTKLIVSPALQSQYFDRMIGEINYKKPDLTLLELVEIYNNEMSRKNVSQTHKEKIYQRILVASRLLEHQNIRMITPEELQKFIYDVQWLPLRLNKNNVAEMDLVKAIRINQNRPELCVSEKTHFDYIYTLRSLFAWALKRKYIKENPFDEVDLPAPEISKTNVKYLPFSVQQLQVIFGSKLFLRHWYDNPKQRTMFWLILLALYTGARLNELCQLEFDDIQEEEGVKYISINEEHGKRVKTRAGIRRVPIHNELISIGFLGFVTFMKKESKNNRIFADLKYNKRGELSAMPSKWFGRFMNEIGLTDKKLVFHSFRHTVRTILRNNNCPEERVQRICGWEGERSLSAHYGTISIKVLAQELNEKLVYEGLNLACLYV